MPIYVHMPDFVEQGKGVGRDSVGFLPTTGQRSNQLNYVPNRGINNLR
jgi:hypothetical protein